MSDLCQTASDDSDRALFTEALDQFYRGKPDHRTFELLSRNSEGFATGNPMNLIMVLAVYATISKALGMLLRHPGTQENYHALYQCTDAALLSRALVWMATDSRCANEPFNITNGDLIRWENLWPKIAYYFGMEVGPRQHIKLTEMMADKASLWDSIVGQHGLRRISSSSSGQVSTSFRA
jgi:hypothetical protein